MTYKSVEGNQVAGYRSYRRAPTYYELFMDGEGIPVYQDVGVHDMRNLPLKPWARMGGNGTFIQLDGTDNKSGMYLVEVPAAGALKPEKHIYEEQFLVIEGRGSTEIWTDDSPAHHTFEWQAGSLFSVPMNAWHLLVNARSSPALILAVTTAPITMNLLPNDGFVFNNPFVWHDRYDGQADFFRPRDDLEPHPETGHAHLRTNIIPDVLNAKLPLDNGRSPGNLSLSLQLAGNTTFGSFVQEYPSGRYSMAHFHDAGPVLICLRGKGFSMTWPKDVGPRPWESGREDAVKRYEYGPFGMISAAPGGEEWFHQHFSIGKEPMRQIELSGGARSSPLALKRYRVSRDTELTGIEVSMKEGGYALTFKDEDPKVRDIYRQRLQEEGAQFQMPDSAYQ